MTTSDSGAPGSGPARLEFAEREALLAVARAAVRAAAHGVAAPPPPPGTPARLLAPGAAFVTLHDREGLRGCVGSVVPHGSLAALVARMARAAARTDPRFPPLRPDELLGLRVEVSVLSPARPVSADEIDTRVHGVSLRARGRGAVLLPQVAVRLGWDRETLLRELCAKADLPADAWRDPATLLVAFTVEVVEDDV
jgi:AmmeMemoRadiSam system protein A